MKQIRASISNKAQFYYSTLAIFRVGFSFLLLPVLIFNSAILSAEETAADSSSNAALENVANALNDLQQQLEDARVKEQKQSAAKDKQLKHFDLGNGHLDKLRFAEAEKEFLKVIALGDTYAAPHLNLGTVYESRLEYLRAISSYKQAARLAPGDAMAAFSLGDVFYKLEIYDKAIAHYKAGLKHQPDDKLSNERLTRALAVDKSKGIIPRFVIVRDLNGELKTRSAYIRPDARSVDLRRIAFARSKSGLDTRSPMSRAQLKHLVAAIKDIAADGSTRFRIENHCDALIPKDQAIKLTQGRAASVVKYLVKETGLPEESFEAVGKGAQFAAIRGANARTTNRMNKRTTIFALQPFKPKPKAEEVVSQEPAVEKPDLKINVQYIDSQGETQSLSAKKPLPRGGRYQVQFAPTNEGHLYVLREDDEGRTVCLYPTLEQRNETEGSVATRQARDTTVILPRAKHFYETAMSEKKWVIRFYVSEKPVKRLDQVALQAQEVGSIGVRGVLAMPVRYSAEAEPALETFVSNQIVRTLPSPIEEVIIETGRGQ